MKSRIHATVAVLGLTLLASFHLHAQVTSDRLLRAAAEPQLVDLFRLAHEPALQPPRSDHARQREN